MSFKQKSSHERWVDYRDSQSDKFELVLASKLSEIKESDFEQYLVTGDHQKFAANVAELTEQEFLNLEKIVNGWFDFQDSLFVFHEQRVSRFGRYG